MAGRGPAPRPAHTQQNAHRRRQREAELQVIEGQRGVQPPLPENGYVVRRKDGVEQCCWHPQTVLYWEHLGESPVMRDSLDVDWDFLLGAMVLHSRYWWGEFHVAQELRLQLTQYGLTVDARARQRMQVAFAEESEKRAAASDVAPSGSVVRQRRGVLKAV